MSLPSLEVPLLQPGGEGAEGSPVDAQEQGLEINK